MKRGIPGLRWVPFLGAALFVAVSARPAAAVCGPDGVQASGAVYRICMPEPGQWNGKLVIWAHGYVAFNRPVAIPEEQLQLPDGTTLPDLVNSMGFAFATTSYSANGTAVRQGLEDIVDLVDVFEGSKGPADRVYVTGASQGGLITALAVEQHPELFAGGLATCGPLGSFPRQINYFSDFRVVFDYFFPGLLPGDPSYVPPELIDNWDSYYLGVIRPVVFAPANLAKTLQLIAVARLPTDRADFWPTAERSIYDALWYNVFGTNDAIEKLGGQPFENRWRFYRGSRNDWRLNRLIQRVAADPTAVAEMRTYYNTSGRLSRPLVTLHTLRDQQVPAWHEALYFWRVAAAGNLGQLLAIPINRYGHCNFTAAEVLLGFGLMVLKAEGLGFEGMDLALEDATARSEFLRLASEHGLPRTTDLAD